MSVVLSKGEKIIYTRDYCKGWGKSVGNVTITDKRLISTIEGKSKMSKTELSIDDISGFRIRFKPTSVLAFIAFAIYACISGVLGIMSNMRDAQGAVDSFGGGAAVGSAVNDLFFIWIIIFVVLAVLNFIIGLISIRNGLYIVARTKPTERINFICVSASGKNVTLKLKPKKDEAFALLDTMSAALQEAKRH